MSTKPEFSDTVFRAFVARREILLAGEGAGAIRIIGSRYSSEAMALRAFANRARLPHTWIDLEDLDDPPVFLASLGVRPRDVPVVFTPTAVLRNPTAGQFAEHLGLTYRNVPGLPQRSRRRRYRSGRARGVGLRRVGRARDALARRGRSRRAGRRELAHRELRRVSRTAFRATSSSRVRRSRRCGSAPGSTRRARWPGSASKTASTSWCSPTAARSRPARSSSRRVRDTGGSRSTTSNASKARASTTPRPSSRRACAAAYDTIVVGGGNSAGQAAIYMAQQGSPVSLVVRRRELSETMSHYLIARIEADDRIDVLQHTEVRGLAGDTHLERGDARGQSRPGSGERCRARGCSVSSARSRRPRGSAVASRSTARDSSSPIVRCRTRS